MKVFLNDDFTIDNIDTEEITQDSVGYNILKVYVPEEVVEATDTFAVSYAALLPSSRKVGAFGMVYSSTDPAIEEGYALFKATLHPSVVSYPGKVAISFQFVYGVDGNATLIKKNSAIIQFDVRKSVAVNNDILILDTDQTTTDVLESYKDLLETALNTYLTQVNAAATYVAKADIVDNLTTDDATKPLSAKQGKALKDNIDANAFTVNASSGLTLSDHKLSVKGSENGGIGVGPAGVKINYDADEFQVIQVQRDFNNQAYLTKVFKNDYYNNSSPVNKRILTEINSANVNYKYKNNLTVATSSGSLEGRTKYTYTFSGITAKKIKANYSHEYYGTDMYGTGYKYDTNLTPKYNLTFDSSDSVCSQFLTHLVKKAINRTYMVNFDTDAYTNISLPSGEVAIFNPVAKVGDIVYFSCPNLVCTMTPTSTIPQILSIVLGLKENNGNYIVEFDVDNTTGTPAEISNNTTVHCLTGMVYDISVTDDNLNLGYKRIALRNSSSANNVKNLINIDNIPTTNSENLVFSGGVKAALDDVEDDVSALQTQVNNLSSVQNVVDIVATKSALDALTTTNFEEDDKVQVIADETHDGASTVYNWTGSAWQYVGAYGGNSYTKAQTDALLDGKADKSTTYTKTEIDTILNTVVIEKSFESLAVDQMTITGYVTQEVLNSIGPRTQVKLRVYDSTNDITFILTPNFTPETNVYNFKCTVNSPIDADGMIEVEGGISIDREYSFVIRNVKIYTEAEVNTLLSSKQDTLSGSTSIDVTSNVVSVKDSYVEGFFATSQEIDNMLEEVFGNE